MVEMMNIQKEKVRKELVSVCLGEFTAVLSIWFCFFLLKNRLGDVNSLVTILYPLSLLTFILLQGSIYWAILIRRLSNPQFGSGTVPKLYGCFRILGPCFTYFRLSFYSLEHTECSSGYYSHTNTAFCPYRMD